MFRVAPFASAPYRPGVLQSAKLRGPGGWPEWRFLNGGFNFKGGLQECVSSKPPALQGDRWPFEFRLTVGWHTHPPFKVFVIRDDT